MSVTDLNLDFGFNHLFNPSGLSTQMNSSNIFGSYGTTPKSTTPVNNPAGTSFGFNTETLGTLANIGSMLMQGYSGMKQIGLARDAFNMAKEQFGFEKDFANRNLSNQATLINNQLSSAANIAAQLGSSNIVGANATTTQQVTDANKKKVNQVDGSPI